MVTGKYAIETIGLVKRYPTTGRRTGGGGRGAFGTGRGIASFGGIFSTLKRAKGPFIEALRGIDLQIRPGEIFGLLGPNGAGKTTFIKILCTLVIHDEGEAYVNGHDVKKEPGEVIKNLQAVLPESRGFNWRLTGRQNLKFYSLLYGVKEKEAEERIDYLLDFTGLKERADDGYQRYSTGMQRKLLICRALLRNTPTLLFDEPTVGLDPTSSAEFRSLLCDKLAREEGKTILISTHNLHEAQDICDRIAILNRGKIIACDTPANIQHMLLEEKVFNITFVNTTGRAPAGVVLTGLEKLPGVNSITPGYDSEGGFNQVSIRVNKDADLSGILELIVKNGLRIGGITTKEPTLEEVFIAMTGRDAGESGRPRAPGGR
ncbi:MAG: ABC transporter ATP-binding protein [Dehalococcoidales bacterium]|nr:MAG: ABC transporter ATP-binding protein [Dehalococcoidales bacterium]